MSIGQTTTFSWRNYSRPTPQNFLRLAKAIKRVLVVMSTGSLMVSDNHWITGGLILAMPLVEELVQFLADASADANAINVEPQVLEKGIVVDQTKV